MSEHIIKDSLHKLYTPLYNFFRRFSVIWITLVLNLTFGKSKNQTFYMPRQIQLNISLEPVFEHDMGTDSYIIWYKEFPEAFAQGRTIEEAENNLIPVLELMWKERPKELEKILLERYINDSHRNDPKVIFPRE